MYTVLGCDHYGNAAVRSSVYESQCRSILAVYANLFQCVACCNRGDMSNVRWLHSQHGVYLRGYLLFVQIAACLGVLLVQKVGRADVMYSLGLVSVISALAMLSASASNPYITFGCLCAGLMAVRLFLRNWVMRWNRQQS